MKSNTPFFDRAARLAELRARFFIPGHKGNPAAIPLFGSVLPFDLTEIKGADDLSHPSGPLAESEANMTRVYGSGATLYSAGGATSCIEAMLGFYLRPGQRVIMARGCHLAALRALVFTGAHPVWLQPEEGRVPAKNLEKVLEKEAGAPVYLTSPDFYGRMSDIGALAKLCKAQGSPLLVDNAHGAHLRFLRPDRHPIALGADAAVDSAHKTLPCLTGAALLHLQDENVREEMRQMLNLYSSTSPSYLILESLDLCAGLLLDAPPAFADAAERLSAAASSFGHLLGDSDDPLKLCLCPEKAGWEAKTVLAALEEAGIYPEFYDGRRIVLMAGPYNTGDDLRALQAALLPFAEKEKKTPKKQVPAPLPEVVCPPREAFFGSKERISIEKAEGRVAAGIDAPCPPGVPLVVPGERLDAELACQMAAGGILQVDVLS